MATALSRLQHHHSQQLTLPSVSPVSSVGEHYCKECGLSFESQTSLEVHISYHRANLLTRWAAQDPNSTPPPNSANTNNMESKYTPKLENPSPRHQTPQTVPSPYFEHHSDPAQGHSHTQYSLPPEYHQSTSEHGEPHFSSMQGRHQGFGADGGQPPHFDGRLPPRELKERSASTPEEILDLDSNKVHIYNLGQQQQLHYAHPNSFYRPYLMSQPIPSPANGNPAQNLQPLPPFPQDPHALSQSQHIYRQNTPPPRSPSNLMSPYDFQPHHPYPPPILPEHTQNEMSYAHSRPPPQPGPNFRTNFPPKSYGGGPPLETRSPDVNLDEMSLRPSSEEGKKGKKTKSGPPPSGTPEESSPAPKTKGWKGGECKRPKTYNCVACNKWFTSSGHLKRHYGTTLHKNSLRQRGENPDETPPQVSGKRSKDGQLGKFQEKSSGEDSGGDSNNPVEPNIPSQHPNLSLASKTEDSGIKAGVNGHGRQIPDFGSAQPPTYLHVYHNGPQGPPPQPPYGMPMGMHPAHAQFHYDPVYTVSVPTTIYNSGYPPALLNGTEQLPPFSTVLSPYDQQFSHHPVYLHQGNVGPPPGPHSPSYSTESGIHSNSTNDGQDHLNGESPEAVRSASTASGLEISDEASDDGATGSTGCSSGSESEVSSGPKVIKCPNCSKTFNRTCYLTQHTNSSHTGGKPFKCPTCGKRFPEEPALSDHVAKHGTNKPYKCDLCPKQFNHKTDLRRHLCLHTGEKPFLCTFCGKGFIRKDHMTKHAETHRKVKGNSTN